MKAEKQLIIDALLERINGSPFVLVADYGGMTVPQFEELRNRLRASGAEFHVEKNTFIKRAAQAAELPEALGDILAGQTAIVTGDSDVCAAAKALKNFHKEFTRPEIRGGALDGEILDIAQVNALADLPAKEVLQAQLMGVLQTPGRQMATVLNESITSLARVLQAKVDKGE